MITNDQEKLRKEVFEKLSKVLSNLLKIFREKDLQKRPQLDWGTDLMDDLGVDSLESMDLMNAIEEEFQVSPNLEEANSKRKLSQIVDYIIELQEQKRIKR